MNNGSANQCMDLCCICGGVVNLMTSQALSLDTPLGKFRVRFHSSCYLQNKGKAEKELFSLYEAAKLAQGT